MSVSGSDHIQRFTAKRLIGCLLLDSQVSVLWEKKESKRL